MSDFEMIAQPNLFWRFGREARSEVAPLFCLEVEELRFRTASNLWRLLGAGLQTPCDASRLPAPAGDGPAFLAGDSGPSGATALSPGEFASGPKNAILPSASF